MPNAECLEPTVHLTSALVRPCRPPSSGDVVIFRPAKGVGRDSSWFDDNVFIKRIVAVEGGWVGGCGWGSGEDPVMSVSLA